MTCRSMMVFFYYFLFLSHVLPVALRRSVKTRLPENSHVHTYPVGEETYDSESDTWTKTCADCGFQVTFEKM